VEKYFFGEDLREMLEETASESKHIWFPKNETKEKGKKSSIISSV
jgi:hypothetical protein